MREIYLNDSGFAKLKAGDPWLWVKDLNRDVRLPKVACVLPVGEHWFFLSPNSDIRLRRFGPAARFWPNKDLPRQPITGQEDFQRSFGESLLEVLFEAWTSKQMLLADEPCFRWIFAENEGLPGLVVDVFNDKAIAQVNSAVTEYFWPSLEILLLKVLKEKRGSTAELLVRRDAAVRKEEGLEIIPFDKSIVMQSAWNGLQWEFEAGGSQKTGAYLDQRDNHTATAKWAQLLKARRAWDVCCFEGGFGLHLAKLGLQVTFVDQSEKALERAKKNLNLNQLDSTQHQFIHGDVFDFIKADSTERPDVIILDPPSFAKDAREKDGAIRGFRELNLRAMKHIAPGGLLVSCVCSHSITRGDYEKLLRQTAHDVRREVRILEVRGAAADHAPKIHFPRSNYLQAWFLQVL